MRKIVKDAIKVLKSGGIIAFPTDTVYGIGCSAFNEKAVERIYKIKGRSFEKPLPIILSSIDDIPLYADDISGKAWEVINKYLPGPLTVVLKKTALILDLITAGQPDVAIRIVAHPVVIEIVNKLGCPLVATSANKSGEKELLTAHEVKNNLGDQIDLVIDGGTCPIGVASTVVDLTVTPFKILRHGAIIL